MIIKHLLMDESFKPILYIEALMPSELSHLSHDHNAQQPSPLASV